MKKIVNLLNFFYLAVITLPVYIVNNLIRDVLAWFGLGWVFSLIAFEFLHLFILIQSNGFRISHKKAETRKMIYQEMKT